MILKSLSDQILLEKTTKLAQEERRITSEILWCLLEVETRLLFASLGFSSLYEFCTQHLGYSEGSAHRRISAMRLLKSLPKEIQNKTEEKMISGDLSVTNLSLVHRFLKTEKKFAAKTYSDDEKSQLIDSLEGLSKKAAEKLLADIQPAFIPQEKERILSSTQTEIKFVATDGLMNKIKRVKELTAHANPNPSYAELFEKMTDLMLAKIEPQLENKSKSKNENETGNENKLSPQNSTSLESSASTPITAKTKPNSRYIPASIKREVWNRDHGSCTFRSENSGKVCGSKFGVEFDHVKPFSFGGTHVTENLRLRCKQHNALEAERAGIRRQ
jgi:5-methylcytosine-specific restriction endonuclease McrA